MDYESTALTMHELTALFLVPETGIEPVRLLKREILSLLCLPISPSGQYKTYYNIVSFKCQQNYNMVPPTGLEPVT